MADGFTSYEGNAKRWEVHHNRGTTFVYATTESIALARPIIKLKILSNDDIYFGVIDVGRQTHTKEPPFGWLFCSPQLLICVNNSLFVSLIHTPQLLPKVCFWC